MSHLFLQGNPCLGKSTILHQCLAAHQNVVAGLAVQRLFKHGVRVGFCAKSVAGELPPLDAEYSQNTEGVFLYKGRQDPAVLAAAMQHTAILCAKPECRVVLLDEIGGFESTDSAVMDALKSIFTLGKPCIGVIKSRRNLDNLLANLATPLPLPETKALYAAHSQLMDAIIKNGAVLTLDVTNAEELRQQVQSFVDNIFTS